MEDYEFKLATLVIAREVIIQAKNFGWTPYEVICEVVGCYNNSSNYSTWIEAEHVIYESLLKNNLCKQPLLDFIK